VELRQDEGGGRNVRGVKEEKYSSSVDEESDESEESESLSEESEDSDESDSSSESVRGTASSSFLSSSGMIEGT
jgi:hypothetical protein